MHALSFSTSNTHSFLNILLCIGNTRVYIKRDFLGYPFVCIQNLTLSTGTAEVTKESKVRNNCDSYDVSSICCINRNPLETTETERSPDPFNRLP